MKEKLVYFIIFALTASLFFWLQSSPTLPDGDSFYHAKIADLLIKEKKVVKDFPWLPLTILKDYYYDHHFLFHLYLIPFILIIGHSLIAIKVATILLGALFFIIFYWFLRHYQIKYALFYLLLPFSAYVLIYRLNLDKVPAASLIFLLLGIYFIFQQKGFWLGILSFFYVWLYDAWPIILLATISYCLAGAIKELASQELKTKIQNYGSRFEIFKFYISSFLRAFLAKNNLKLILACILGLTLGIVINPYFPNNLKFFWIHIIKIGLITPGTNYGVGAEWYPYDLLDLLWGNFLVCLAWFFTLALIFIELKRGELKQTKESFSLFLLTAIFFLYTLKARRMGEYFVPLATLSTAFAFNQYLKEVSWQKYWQSLRKFLLNPNFFTFNIFLVFILFIFLGFFFDSSINRYLEIKKSLSEGWPFQSLQKASEFLKKNTPPGSLIFHDSWVYFPMLFYYNDRNSYLTGLDNTFMYEKNPTLYSLWQNIVSGKEKENLAEKIKDNFNSAFVLVKKPKTEKSFEQKFIDNLKNDKHFQKIYEDEEAMIYQLMVRE